MLWVIGKVPKWIRRSPVVHLTSSNVFKVVLLKKNAENKNKVSSADLSASYVAGFHEKSVECLRVISTAFC